MRPSQSVETRNQLVHARVVLHSARAERVEAEVDGVIPSGKPREVADDFHLADFGKAFDFGAHVGGAERGGGVHRRHVERGKLIALLARRTPLEQKIFVLRDVRADFVDHAACWAGENACATSSICSRLLISVAHKSTQFSSSGYQRASGRPPMTLFLSKAWLISSGERPLAAATNSLKNGPLKRGCNFPLR